MYTETRYDMKTSIIIIIVIIAIINFVIVIVIIIFFFNIIFIVIIIIIAYVTAVCLLPEIIYLQPWPFSWGSSSYSDVSSGHTV